MRLLLAASVVIGLLLPAAASASPFGSSRSVGAQARKTKRPVRSEKAPLVVEGASAKRSKRRADDPVLRRYGMKPQDVSYVDYKASKKSKATRDDDEVAIEKPAKKPAKKAKAAKRAVDEEILIIEETPAKKPAKKAKAKPVADDDEKPAKKSKTKPVADDEEFTIIEE